MAEVSVDLSDLRRVHRKAKRQLSRHARVMMDVVKRAAVTEQRTSTYKNRTGLLRTNTMALLAIDNPDMKVVILGMFMDPVSLMMVTLPLFMPVIRALGFDLVWFGVLTLISITIGAISPPFGLSLFVMKGVASPGTTMGDIYRASLPWIALSLLVVALVIAFPQIALWLPAQMY